MKKVFFSVAALGLAACSNAEERYDVGYDDGYAVGYNETCKIRSTLIDGDFNNKHYSRGYSIGYTDGSLACMREQNEL